MTRITRPACWLLAALVLGMSAAAPAQQAAPVAAPADSVTAPPAPTPPKQPSQPFEQGRWRGGLFGGYGSSFGDSYFIVGGSISRVMARGLDAGVDFETWLGSDPGLSKVSPQLRYVLLGSPRTMPYLGAFYSRTFVGSGLDDWNSWGGRAGVYQRAGRATMIGAGVVVEQYLDCDEDCTEVYPEASVSLFF